MFGAEKHGITHIERIRDELWNLIDKVKITFNKTIAPITVGTSITGLFHVIPSFFKVVRCQKCQKFGHGTRQCKAKAARGHIIPMIAIDGTMSNAQTATQSIMAQPTADAR